MATTNQTVYRLYIALIVFVVLTFILAITTYLFFSKYSAEAALRKDAQASEGKKNSELENLTTQYKKLHGLVTEDEGKSVDDLDTELRVLLETDFNGIADGKEDPHYARLVNALRKHFHSLNEARRAAEAAREETRAKAEADVAAARAAQESAEKAKADAEAERDSNRQKWEEDWKKHESELTARLEERKEADARAQRLENLMARIHEAEVAVPVERRPEFKAKEGAEEQLEMLLDTLKSTTSILQDRNKLIDKLRADERPNNVVDEIDGRIVEVDEDGREATILFPTTNRIRIGLIFMVFQAGVLDPQVANSKGRAQVVAVEGSLVRARLFGEQTRNPISPGDWVSSRLWDAREVPEVVVIGFVDMNRDGVEDRRVLEDMLRQVEARVEKTVSPTTTLVIDAGTPSSAAENAAAIETKREKEIRQASTYGHRVIGVDEALRLLGVEETSTANR